MQYFILLLLFSFFIFLFTLFALCRDDFVLFRKNVDMEKVFNLAFLVGFLGLFFSRLFFVILNFKPVYLHPLAFSLFPYFPGLSLPGGLLGGSLALLFFLRGKKYPEGRLFDFFILAFTVTLIIAQSIMVVILYIPTKQLAIIFIAQLVVFLLLFLLSLRVFKKHSLKEGSVGLAMVFFLSITYCVSAYFQMSVSREAFYKEVGMWGAILLLSLFLFLRQQSLLSFLTFFGKK